MALSRDDKQKALEAAADLGQTLIDEGPAGLAEKLNDKVGELLDGFKLDDLLPDGIKEGLNIISKITGIGASAPSPCKNVAAEPCGSAGSATMQHEISPNEGGSNPLQGTDAESREAASGLFAKLKELASEAEKLGLTNGSFNVTQDGDKTIIEQAFDFVPKNIGNLISDLVGEDGALSNIPVVGDVLPGIIEGLGIV